MTIAEFLDGIANRPWTPRENCWWLASRFQFEVFGRVLPMARVPKSDARRHKLLHSHPARARWNRTDRPVHGALVLMSSMPEPRLDRHCGTLICMPSPIVVHTDNPHGVVIDDLMTCRQRGWFPEFYIPA